MGDRVEFCLPFGCFDLTPEKVELLNPLRPLGRVFPTPVAPFERCENEAGKRD
jgi:hypothetical protein